MVVDSPIQAAVFSMAVTFSTVLCCTLEMAVPTCLVASMVFSASFLTSSATPGVCPRVLPLIGVATVQTAVPESEI